MKLFCCYIVPCIWLTVDLVCAQGDLALHVLRRPPGHHRVEDELSRQGELQTVHNIRIMGRMRGGEFLYLPII